MESLLTSFIYPLEEPFIISEYLSFSFDNPRTELEQEVIKDYLIRSYESGYDMKFPVTSDLPIVTLEDTLLNFRDNLSPHDPYVIEKFKDFQTDQIFDFLASIWVIARFDDEGIGKDLQQHHQKMRVEGIHSFFMLEDDHILVQRPKDLASYCSLLSLLIHTEKDSYYGRSILADSKPLSYEKPTERVWQDFIFMAFASSDYPESQDESRWVFFPYVKDDIVSVSSKLDSAFRDGHTEKLLFIGSILNLLSHETRDIKTMLILLTSIIELLLTHNPDFSRYNVEDSINKQFQLKASLVIYLNDKTRNIYEIRNRLRTIYQQRSNVAHGNFKAFNKYEKNLCKKEGKEEYLDDLISDLYMYNRSIIEEFLKDYIFIKFLKDN